ncbi:MAG: hypothetical protein HQL79_01485 [Magnetococcales bacterium]|nr:hypothetical protein [Magnetococcales bacterium]
MNNIDRKQRIRTGPMPGMACVSQTLAAVLKGFFMEHQDAFTKISSEKGTQTFFFATRGDLLECLNERKKHGVASDKHRLKPRGRSLAMQARLAD